MVYAGFRDARRDIQDPPESAQASPDPHDEELMDARPDREEMEEAINKFLLQLEKQEKKGFKDLASILSQLPKPAQGSVPSISVAGAIKAGFLPSMDEDQADMFTPSELHLYRHAQDHRLNRDIPGYPWIYQFLVLGYPGILPLNRHRYVDPTDIDMLVGSKEGVDTCRAEQHSAESRREESGYPMLSLVLYVISWDIPG